MNELLDRIATKGVKVLVAVNGLPLCGKTTVADGIATKVNGARITTSSALRGLNNPKVNYQIDNGILVEDKVVIKAIEQSLRQIDRSTVIIDGCFRTENQTRAIIANAHDSGFTLVVAIEVNVTYPTIRERFGKRGRKDDTLQKVVGRIRDYEHHAPRTVFALRDLTRYQIMVNGDQPQESVLRDALDKLEIAIQDHLDPYCVFSGR